MNQLNVKLRQTHDGGPLVEIASAMLGEGAELRPARLRALANALLQAADDAEARKLQHRGKPLPAERRTYSID